MSFKPLFARTLGADPDRLHFAAHSHHLWPDASYEGQVQAWEDAARLADRKWDKVLDEVWPQAQTDVATQLGSNRPGDVVFSSNTHDFILRLVAACPRRGATLNVLTSDGEFHSARRQFDRWAEDGWLIEDRIAAAPFEAFADRFVERARTGTHDLIFISHVMFASGRVFERNADLAALARPEGPWVVVDGYHAFMAIDSPLPADDAAWLFYLGGGYKYAMAGEGCAFVHAPSGFGPRPPVTGWYAEFEDLSLPPGIAGYASDARRFLGATFDPSPLYRFVAVQRMLRDNGLTTARISGHCDALRDRLLEAIGGSLAGFELLNPEDGQPHARFLAFRGADAATVHAKLRGRNIVTDVRGDILRIGFGLYQDDQDVDYLAEALRGMAG